MVLSALLALTIGCGDAGSSGGAGTGGSGSSGGGESLPTVDGCDGAKLLLAPENTSQPGPWDVGARTLTIGDLTVEAWYPAKPGSSTGESARYDVRDHLPASELGKIADEDAPIQTCDCERDLPADSVRGPYPLIVFVHGTAGFRTQSLEITSHWASRGFVVLAADHPGLSLHDLLGALCGAGAVTQDLQGDLDLLVATIQSGSGLGDLADVVDSSRIGMSGHSAGGGAIDARGDDARVLIPMAAGGFVAGTKLESGLVLGAVEDTVVEYAEQEDGFEAAPSPKRLVGVSPAGHLVFSSLCHIENEAGQDLVEIGEEAEVCGLDLAGALFDCRDDYVSKDLGHTIVNDASTAVFEETLHCNGARTAWIGTIESRYPEVADYLEEL